jgi:hypothetical protein
MLQDLHLRLDLNLNDMFFKYGFRINPDIVKDEQGSPIKLATGEQGSATQYQEFKFCPIGLSGEFAPDSEKSRRNQI